MRKEQSQKVKRNKKRGGNKKPQTFKDCENCGKEFGPVERLAKRFCSKPCWYKWQKKQPKKPRLKPTKKARNAQRLLKYYIDKGDITRPSKCEECGEEKKIEGAHKDYNKSLDVRWLCVSCHRKWDYMQPKNGVIDRWEKFTGQTAERIL